MTGVKIGAEGAESKQVSASRCPQCAAAVRPDARWCSLCHASLGPAPVVDVAPSVPDPVPATSEADQAAGRARGRHAKGRVVPADAGASAPVAAPSPVAGQQTKQTSDLDLAALALLDPSLFEKPLLDLQPRPGAPADPDGQLAMFDEPLTIDRIDLSALADRPVVRGRWNELASHLDSNGAKAVVMVVGMVAVSVVLFGLMTLVGVLFT